MPAVEHCGHPSSPDASIAEFAVRWRRGGRRRCWPSSSRARERAAARSRALRPRAARTGGADITRPAWRPSGRVDPRWPESAAEAARRRWRGWRGSRRRTAMTVAIERVRASGRPTDRVHAAVHAVKASSRHPVLDGLRRSPARSLRMPDNPMLGSSEPEHDFHDGWCFGPMPTQPSGPIGATAAGRSGTPCRTRTARIPLASGKNALDGRKPTATIARPCARLTHFSEHSRPKG